MGSRTEMIARAVKMAIDRLLVPIPRDGSPARQSNLHQRSLELDQLFLKTGRPKARRGIGCQKLGQRIGQSSKTAIVNYVYNKQKEERSFDFHTWITVSHSLKGRKLLQIMVQSFQNVYGSNRNGDVEINEFMDVELISEIRKYLCGRRYMIVFYDVRDIDFWKMVEPALPYYNNSSQVIITARDKGVAEFCQCFAPTHVHELQPLDGNNALKLFYHKVLLESYNDLPYHLKSCLLYFGLLPKDHYIRCARLINLWITKGLVMQNGNADITTLQEVAEEYLDELICEGLVKALDVSPSGRVRIWRIHYLMHDLILSTCQEMNFCHLKTREEEFKSHASARRLSIQDISPDDPQSTGNYKKVRSCLVFNMARLPNPVLESMLLSFHLLIGLDIEGSCIDYLPEAAGNLLLLKYLSLRRTTIKTIPMFIKKLQNLEYLDLKYTHVRELPKEIYKLIKLRSLITNYLEHGTNRSISSFRGAKVPEGIGCLRALEKLTAIDVADDGGVVINDLKTLNNMRRLSITGLRRHKVKLLCYSIETMSQLCSLSICGAEEREVIELEPLNKPPQKLQRLYLDARIERLPN
ncbi:disease resistance protein Pik-2-like [Prosopis cineraria]|uniref:disease resistance protein Pik-2-like n=1 Tax=Prosopis cineraria TaxID=364024 RepID=UPI00240F313F|nr:disease resistance protein Pik-2-like [Prosopis cineraria]